MCQCPTHRTLRAENQERRQDPKKGEKQKLQLNIYDSDDNAEIKNQLARCERATGEELYKNKETGKKRRRKFHQKTPPGYHFANNSKLAQRESQTQNPGIRNTRLLARSASTSNRYGA